MGSWMDFLLHVASVTLTQPRDCWDPAQYCSDAKEESAELGAALHSDEGAAGVVQEDRGVLPPL